MKNAKLKVSKYIPVIGLEVHVELKTNSKMFCGCSADYFGRQPNTHTCPVCLGLPGALPVPNKKAVEWCVMIGMSLGCEIPLTSKFDRKNYFYPDLAKGYQISQYDQPFAINGGIEINRHSGEQSDSRIDSGQARMTNKKRIRIRRVHMEEDTGKLIHETVNGKKVSLIDFNRSGVPLVEIVTEPDFVNAKEVVEYLKKLQQIVRYLGVSNADMEKGEMRLEPNISLRPSSHPGGNVVTDRISSKSKKDSIASLQNDNGFELPKYKVEVKNINSFSFVEKAIEYEIKRQAEILDRGEIPLQETRGYVENGNKTVTQRSKEEAQDYRYFPEPDIPPIRWEKSQIESIKSQIPELPEDKLIRFVKEYGLSEYNAEQLTREKNLADYFENCVKDAHTNKHDIKSADIANWIINKKIDIDSVLPAEIIKQIIVAGSVTGIDPNELEKILKAVIEKNPKVVQDYKHGRENAIMFLVGQAMRELKGREKAEKIKEEIKKLI